MVMHYPLGVMYKFCFWNIRGLNSLSKQKHIKWFLHTQEIGLFGLLETKGKPSSLIAVRNTICENWCVSTNTSWHKGGRIWILWNLSLFNIQYLEYNAQFIHLNVIDRSTGTQFYCSFVYDFNGVKEIYPLWKKYGNRAQYIQFPWIIVWDFNTVLAPSERLGGQSTMEEMQDFQQFIDNCEVIDMPASGSYYTWNNKQDPETRVYSRLDRAFVNTEWLDTYKDTYALFHTEGDFDHTPCTIQDMTWKNLEYIQEHLSQDPLNSEWIMKETEAIHTYKELNSACNSYLLQKSTWISEGDNNTKYFQSVIKGRHCMNKVLRIRGLNGNLCTDPSHIQNAFLEYYKTLLGTSDEVIPVNLVVVQQGRIFTPEHCSTLLRPITDAEIREAIFSIPSHKAPGPDGYSSGFFKDTWHITGENVCSAIQDFFHTAKLLKQLNHTLVNLIPKIEMPLNITHFRPIACCNVLYKAISKLLCARLARVLPPIICENQGGFIHGRSIVENILVCQDIIRLYNRASA
ncbi:uncharacterized protein LOC141656786 [Silene latifolia]|uniref:uncharacterized protein LOC141656786 n=1 Tax=Silene latifolia TaxID=37657 RepID=UPI003D78B04A